MMAAGKLDQRITFQQKVVTRTDIGGEATTYTDVCTVWAEAIPLRGREFFAAQSQQQAVDVRFRLRRRADLAGDMRLLWRGVLYDIVSIIPGTAQYFGMLEIMAVSGVRSAHGG